MKTIKLLLIIVLPCLVSCNMVRFDTPMPLDGKKEKSFTPSLVGKYYAADSMFDSSTYNEKYFPDIFKTKDSVKTSLFNIEISKSTVIYTEVDKSYYDTTKLNINSFNLEEASISDKRIIVRKTLGHYVLIENTQVEKIVDLKKDVLKQKAGIYYVNLKNDAKDWNTYQLIQDGKGGITVNTLIGTDLVGLPDNFEVKKEKTNSYIENMTVDKFDYLLQHDFFTKFIMIKKY